MLTDTFALAQLTTVFTGASLTGYSFVYFLPQQQQLQHGQTEEMKVKHRE